MLQKHEISKRVAVSKYSKT